MVSGPTGSYRVLRKPLKVFTEKPRVFWGFFVSRTPTTSGSLATSTHMPESLLQRELLCQMMSSLFFMTNSFFFQYVAPDGFEPPTIAV
jgi:hypothetical protein